MSHRVNKSRRYPNREVDRGHDNAPRCHQCPWHQRDVPTRHSGPGKIHPLRLGLRRLPPKARLFINGERPEEIFVLYSGWAYRYKLLHDGSRQILDFILPGDMIGLPNSASAPHLDHSVDTITEVHLCAFPAQLVLQRLHTEPELASRMIWIKASQQARAFERMTTLGRYDSRQRVAHLLLEILTRLRLGGAISGMSCEFPLTQSILADALGLSTVHVNCILRQFREEGLATVADRTLVVRNLEALEDLCDFDDSYLNDTTPLCDPIAATDSQATNRVSDTDPDFARRRRVLDVR